MDGHEPTLARRRTAPIEMDPDAFRAAGHQLVDRLADFLATLPEQPVSPGAAPAEVRALLSPRPLPAEGEDPARLVEESAELLLRHSLFNGHPRFFGYITSSAAPIGALGDMLAAAVNPNVGGWPLSPMASEIEAQTVRWIAELIGYPVEAGGLLVSGGNAANLVGFWTGRHAMLGRVRTGDAAADAALPSKLRAYVSAETHTWIDKAADLSGLGRDAVRWVPTDAELRMDLDALREMMRQDESDGLRPFLVVGTAGTVSTGAVDPLRALATLCREKGLWFHVDGAYGAPAAVLPGGPEDLAALALADSLAVDPHKWLYAPLEAGCAFVRDPGALRDTFTYHPPYYPDEWTREDAPITYSAYGPQNSRGFRALKVWLALRQVGREGYVRMIGDDVALAGALRQRVEETPALEAGPGDLSICTFRYVPGDLRGDTAAHAVYLDDLNRTVLQRMQDGGQAYPSHAVVDGRFLLRACIVNFRTDTPDVEALAELTVRLGREVDAEMRGAGV
ncbi:MAG: aminotransferase class V-fold PLP-dependent enzyme [Trueperaceae bacterium]|nr:aminotransferase class V-fold PLP-dependent enzyme [Trueperaceae bacterium]